MQADDSISSGTAWHTETAGPAAERPRLLFDLDVDVCVVGGGLAGLTVAREVARRGWSVAVLEAQTVGSGASGRNIGFVLPGFLESIDRIVERVGVEHARQLWALSEEGVEYIRRTIRETQMPGVLHSDGWLQVAKFREDPGLASQARVLREEFGAEVESWPAGRVREHLKSPHYHNAIHFPRAFNIHPVNYVRGLAAAAEQAGARIFEHTPALSLDPAGIRKRVGTPSARVRAGQIVLAGNTGLGALMPRLAASLLPVTSYVAMTVPLGERVQEAIAYPGGVSDTDFIDSHYRLVGDRLVWSGGLTMWEGDPKRYARRLARDIRRAYPQLGPVDVEHVWSGTAGGAVHRMPQIGELMPGLWVSGAYGGQGFNTSAVAGELIARGIVEGDQTWRLFSPYDLVWAGGGAGRAAMQVMYSLRRLRERLQAQLSRPAEPHQEDAPAAEAAPVLVGELPAAMPAMPAAPEPPPAAAEPPPSAAEPPPAAAAPPPAAPVPAGVGAEAAPPDEPERLPVSPLQEPGAEPAPATSRSRKKPAGRRPAARKPRAARNAASRRKKEPKQGEVAEPPTADS